MKNSMCAVCVQVNSTNRSKKLAKDIGRGPLSRLLRRGRCSVKRARLVACVEKFQIRVFKSRLNLFLDRNVTEAVSAHLLLLLSSPPIRSFALNDDFEELRYLG